MTYLGRNAGSDRTKALLAVALLHILLGYAFVSGLAFEAVRQVGDRLTAFDVRQAVPPPPAEAAAPSDLKTVALEQAPASPGAAAQPVPVVAPPPVVRLDVPPPVAAIAAPAPVGPGAGVSSGTSNATGSGSGGTGEGAGSGGAGAGAGTGAAVGARLRSGYISSEDYPKAAMRAKAEGTTHVRYTVGIDGRASGCAVVKSSGNADLDSVTCSLIEKRFRFAPATDAQGRPVPDMLTKRYVWRLPLL